MFKTRYNPGMTGTEIVNTDPDGEAPPKHPTARLARDGYEVLARRPRGFEAGDVRGNDRANELERRYEGFGPMAFPD